MEKYLKLLSEGAVLAYPTEAVYGLGCDPWNEKAVLRLLSIKQRSSTKGLILLIHTWDQLNALTLPIPDKCMQKIQSTWPGPVTWVFPKSSKVPAWISGAFSTVAIRMTEHPVARQLCAHGPVVSTSANLMNNPPIKDFDTLTLFCNEQNIAIVPGPLGNLMSPTPMFDVLSGEVIR